MYDVIQTKGACMARRIGRMPASNEEEIDMHNRWGEWCQQCVYK